MLWDGSAWRFNVSRVVSFNESRSLNEEKKVQNPVTDKNKTIALATVEEETDIDTINDGSQGDFPSILEQEKLIASCNHL